MDDADRIFLLILCAIPYAGLVTYCITSMQKEVRKHEINRMWRYLDRG